MADNYRYRYGESNPITVAYKVGVPVSIGDMTYIDTSDGNTIKPASSYAWQADLPTTQAAFVGQFIGINTQRWDGTNPATGNKDGTLSQNTEGVHVMACAAGSTFNIGDLVGPDQVPGVQQLLSQQVVKVSAKANAIGRVEKPVASSSSVYVRLFASKQTGISS
jgi:hypothetical protein